MVGLVCRKRVRVHEGRRRVGRTAVHGSGCDDSCLHVFGDELHSVTLGCKPQLKIVDH